MTITNQHYKDEQSDGQRAVYKVKWGVVMTRPNFTVEKLQTGINMKT